MKDITHYFHSPVSLNGRVATTETNSSDDIKCIKSLKNTAEEIKTVEVLSDESAVATGALRTPKKKRRKHSPFSKKGKKIPPERAREGKSNDETNGLPSKEEAIIDIEVDNVESETKKEATVDAKVDNTDCAMHKNKSTNAFLILMSPKTKPITETTIEVEEVALTAVKENISLNTSAKLKLTTKSKKRKKKEELEEENIDKNKKKVKYDKAERSRSILGDCATDPETNSEPNEREETIARKKQNFQDTDSKIKRVSKLRVKDKKKKICDVNTDSKEEESLPGASEKSSGDSGNGPESVDIDNENKLSEKEVSNEVKKNEIESKENKRKRKNRLSLRTKSTSDLLRKHSSPETSLVLSPETETSVKTPNSLLKYFNRVSGSVSEKVEVKALVHSPPVSPSVKMRMKIKQQLCASKSAQLGNGMLSPARKAGWKLRVKLRSQEEEDEITVFKDGEDISSSDDHIFTPEKKKVVRRMSVQQQAASLAVKKAMVVLTKMKSPKSPLNVYKAARSPKKIISPNKQKAVVNLAPLFTRAKSRTKKVDASVVEARKKFLTSGVPEQVKRILEIQRSMEEQQHYVFPTVSHVQQREDTAVWNLPAVVVPVNSDYIPPQLQEVLKLGEFSESTALLPTQPVVPEVITQQSYKTLLEGIKAAFPEFPVYRTFRRLREKAATLTSILPKAEDKKQKRRSRRVKKLPCEEENVVPEPLGVHKMWTEKYKPLSGQEVVGNSYSVARLRKWLEAWKRYSEEAQKRAVSSTKKRKEDASSGDEFVDSDSGDSETNKLPDNTVILVGPYGIGKTCAVYAIANELGFKVLEINSSSKRNGKRILSELQEATQSHQVQAKGDHPGSNLNSFFKTTTKNTDASKKSKSMIDAEVEDDATSSRMSLILVEGVEVVYEDHDEGFISALNTLVVTSKRPVVLVTSDPHCAHISRFMDQHLVLKFRQPPVRSLSVWLQLVCLLEGLSVSRTEIERLLDLNSGDVRRTLLQLQYWVLSGGDKINGLNSLPAITAPAHAVAIDVEDEQSNMSWDSAPEEVSILENSGVVRTFVDRQLVIEGVPVLYPTDLDHIWWNTAALLSLSEVSTHRYSKADAAQADEAADGLSEDVPEVKSQPEENTDVCESPEEVVQENEVEKCSQQEIDAMANLMDTFSHVDALWQNKKSCATQGIWRQPVKDGISLHQDLKLCHWQAENTSRNICNYLLEQGFTFCRNKLKSEQTSNFRLSRPSQQDFNWQLAQHAANKAVLPAVPMWSLPQHRAVCSDYLPLLRTIIRYEKTRLAANTKRGNRFFHYLKGLNVHAGEATFEKLSQVFATKH